MAENEQERKAEMTTIPEKGKTIKKSAYAYQKATLGDVVIASGTTKIGECAFEWNESLTSVKIPASVAEIQSDAFSKCTNLSSVEIEAGSKLKVIPYTCFKGCENLGSVVLPEGIETISEYAFKECPSLKSISIPSSVVEIGYAAFWGCKSLGPIIWGPRNILVACPFGEGKLEIPVGAKVIASRLFESNKTITEVVIPEGVEEIEDHAFWSMKNLVKVVLPSTIKKIGESAFSYNEKLAEINVPAGAEVDESAFEECPLLGK